MRCDIYMTNFLPLDPNSTPVPVLSLYHPNTLRDDTISTKMTEVTRINYAKQPTCTCVNLTLVSSYFNTHAQRARKSGACTLSRDIDYADLVTSSVLLISLYLELTLTMRYDICIINLLP